MYKYGRDWPDFDVNGERISPRDIALMAFRCRIEPVQAFWDVIAYTWGESAPKKLIRNAWTERMAEEAIINNYLGVSGCASSGKTTFFAVWALVCWLCDPFGTKVLVTSTSLRESRKRVWGQIKEFYLGTARAVQWPWMKKPLPYKPPGKLIDSEGKISLTQREMQITGFVTSDRSGIEMIPGDPSKENEASRKLIGIKALNKLVFICDELPELNHAILGSVPNLASNNLQLIGLGNFKSMFDPFGQLVKPVQGYANLGEATEWEFNNFGMRGKCIRFDGQDSPNVLAGENIYPGLYSTQMLEMHLQLGRKSPQFWRMCRSLPCPANVEFCVVSEADMVAGHAFDKAVWVGSPVPIAGADPAFTTGGDEFVVQFGLYGQLIDGTWAIASTDRVVINVDVTNRVEPENFQRARLLMEACRKRGVPAENIGLDVTGAGISFGDIVAQVWSPSFHRVQFGGAASEIQATTTDERTGKQAYGNRVTQILFDGAEFIRAGQVRSLPEAVARQLNERQFDTIKREGALAVIVESKKEMKIRLGHSPDDSDAWAIMVNVAREVLGAVPGGTFGAKDANPRSAFTEMARACDDVYSEPVSDVW